MIVPAIAFPDGLEQFAVKETESGTFPDVGDTFSEQIGGSGGMTVMVAEPVMLPEVAVMLATPTPTPVAKPPVLIEATVGVSEDQVTEAVTSCVLKSLKVPVAVNCCVVPNGIDGFAGVTVIDVSTAAVTLSVVLALTKPDVAVIFVMPNPALVAWPL